MVEQRLGTRSSVGTERPGSRHANLFIRIEDRRGQRRKGVLGLHALQYPSCQSSSRRSLVGKHAQDHTV